MQLHINLRYRNSILLSVRSSHSIVLCVEMDERCQTFVFQDAISQTFENFVFCFTVSARHSSLIYRIPNIAA